MSDAEISLSAEDAARGARLYEEARARLYEIGLIASRAVGNPNPGPLQIALCHPFEERVHIKVQDGVLTITDLDNGKCVEYDTKKKVCRPCPGVA